MKSFAGVPELEKRTRNFCSGSALATSGFGEVEKYLAECLLCRRQQDSSKPPTQVMKEIAESGPRQVCQYQFKKNDIVWTCRNCQKDDTCVLCNDCYQNSTSHAGHDVFFYHSMAGGCCDCGCPDAWNTNEAFCRKHGRVVDNPIDFIPSDIKVTGDHVFAALAEGIASFCEEFVEMLGLDASLNYLHSHGNEGEMFQVTMYHDDDYHSSTEFGDVISSAEAAHLIHLQTAPSYSNFTKEGKLMLLNTADIGLVAQCLRFFHQRGWHVGLSFPRLMKQEELYIAAMQWLQNLSAVNDGFCRLIADAFNERVLVRIMQTQLKLTKNLARAVYNFLLEMVADAGFKMRTAMLYASIYPLLCKQFSEGWAGQSHSGFTLFALAVQFLNRELYVNEIAVCHSFLNKIISGVNDMLLFAKIQANLDMSPSKFENGVQVEINYRGMGQWRTVRISIDNNHVPVLSNGSMQYPVVFDDGNGRFEMIDQRYIRLHWLQHGVMKKRKYLPILGDLKIAATIDGVSRLFLSTCMDSYLTLLKNAQWLNPQTRSVYQHVLYEDTLWTSAFNYTICVSSLYDLLTDWIAIPDSTVSAKLHQMAAESSVSHDIKLLSVLNALDAVFERYAAWIQEFVLADNRPMVKIPSIQKEADVTTFNLHEKAAAMSFHMPLTRFLSASLLECTKCTHHVETLTQFQAHVSFNEKLLINALDFPLQVIAFASEIRVGIWRRNGQVMMDQLLNYIESPYSRLTRNLDYTLIQFCLSAMNSSQDLFFRQLFHRFGVLEYIRDPEVTLVKGGDSSYRPMMLDECLKVFINLITELPTPPLADKEAYIKPLIRREMIHELVEQNDCSNSKLHDCLAIFKDGTDLNNDFVDAVIAEIAERRTVYKQGLPTTIYVLKKHLWCEYDPCYSTLTEQGHQAAIEKRPKVTANQPIVSAPLPAHPAYDPIRPDMVTEPFIYTVMLRVLVSTVANRTDHARFSYIRSHWTAMKCSESSYNRALQILTLFLHIIDAQAAVENTAGRPDIRDAFVKFMLYPEETVGTHSLSTHGSAKVSLVQVVTYLYISCLDGVDNNGKHWLGWILDRLRDLDIAMQEEVDRILAEEQKAIDAKRAEMEAKKNETRQKALSDVQANAARFLAMMEEEEDEEEIDAGAGGGAAGSGEEQQAGMELMAGENEFGEAEDEEVGDMEGVEADELGNYDNSPQFLSAVAKARLPICITCQNTEEFVPGDNSIGYLALCQASRTLLSSAEIVPNHSIHHDENAAITMKHNTFGHDVHIGFCGHAMHSRCFENYFHTARIKNDYNQHLLYDSDQGQFPCPLCKKLNNIVIPVSVFSDECYRALQDSGKGSPVKESTSGHVRTWLQWGTFPSMINCDASLMKAPSGAADSGDGKSVSRAEKHGIEDLNGADAATSGGLKPGKRIKPVYADELDMMPEFQNIINEGLLRAAMGHDSAMEEFWKRFPFVGTCEVLIIACRALEELGCAPNYDFLQSTKEVPGFLTFCGVRISPDTLLLCIERSISSVVYTLCCEAMEVTVKSTPMSVENEDTHESAEGAEGAEGESNTAKEGSDRLDNGILIESVVDLLASTLHFTSLRDGLQELIFHAWRGTTQTLKKYGLFSTEEDVDLGSLQNANIHWLKLDQEGSITPLLHMPMLELLVASIALAKSAYIHDFKGTEDGSATSVSQQTEGAAGASAGGFQPLPFQSIGHCYRWICIAKLTQLLYFNLKDTAQCSDECSFIEWPSLTSFLVQAQRLINPTLFPNSAVLRRSLYEWAVFLHAVNHILLRNVSIVALASFSHLSSHTFDNPPMSPEALTDQQLHSFILALDLPELISCKQSNVIAESLIPIIAQWIPDAMACRDEFNLESKTSPDDPNVVIVKRQVMTEPPLAIKDKDSESMNEDGADDVLAGVGAMVERSYVKVKTFLLNLHEYRYLHFRPIELINLPREYTKLHGEITSRCAYEAPALCLICGKVLDSGGKGNCTHHATSCSGDIGIFFLLQDCMVLLFYGPRAIYYPSPYVDQYGESQQSHRGKPLYLSKERYETLRRLWASNGVAREQGMKRSAANRFIIQGYY